MKSGELLNTFDVHSGPILHLRFNETTLVVSSKVNSPNNNKTIMCIYTKMQDKTITVWNKSGHNITHRHVLEGHRAAVNVVDLDEKFIVSASGDKTLKVSV